MKSEKAFTLVELLVVAIIFAVLSAILLPALAATRGNSQKINCINNQKQIGLAFRTWEARHGDRYPQAVSYTSGGASEYVAHLSTTAPANLNPGMVFMVMSNELSTPKILFCPSDSLHTAGNGYATNFSYPDLLNVATPTGTAMAAKQNAPGKISYFVNGDASESSPQDIMIGDINIGNTTTANNGASSYSFNMTGAGYVTRAYAVQLSTISWSTYAGAWAWTALDFHKKTGNLGMADGSCQSVSITGLHFYLQNSTNSTMGAFSFPY